MEAALTVLAYAFAFALVLGLAAFVILCVAMLRASADADKQAKRTEGIREEIDRGARLKGRQL